MEKWLAKTVEEAVYTGCKDGYMKGFEIGVRKAYNEYRDRFSDEEIEKKVAQAVKEEKERLNLLEQKKGGDK
jgi:hypothetical protein